ncbi:hypothetical protein NG791_11880, partial [Laspinema sp. D1]|uniref:hypothetical protein n=1 Tax=Laspinema palackyanum TaxID=3231601 RepID=UPI003479A192|nr:hypothetical protein [Laspinema sp. D2b]
RSNDFSRSLPLHNSIKRYPKPNKTLLGKSNRVRFYQLIGPHAYKFKAINYWEKKRLKSLLRTKRTPEGVTTN